jgi:hypothetical protein
MNQAFHTQPGQDIVESAFHRREKVGKGVGDTHAVDDKREKNDGLDKTGPFKPAGEHNCQNQLHRHHDSMYEKIR